MARHHHSAHGHHKPAMKHHSPKHASHGHMYEHHSDSYTHERAGTDPRRTDEMQEAGMIHHDPHAIANMPQEVMMKPWHSNYSYMPEGLDDTERGIEHQVGYDDSHRAKNNVPKKV